MALAIGSVRYVGSALQNQQITPRGPRLRTPEIPEGLTRAEISEVLRATLAGSAEFLGALSDDPEIVSSPAHLATLARNVRRLAEILDGGADALASADE